MQTIHLMLYSEALDSAEYRATANASSACLTITDVPEGTAAATVARHANETTIAQPVGQCDTVSYDRLGRGLFVNLYRGVA